MIGVMKETKSGAEIRQYLPSSPEKMMEKLALLTGELSAGNTAVLPQIVAMLARLYQKSPISYKDYKSFFEL